jgi:hypothetical protein
MIVLVPLVPALALAATIGDITSVAWVVLGDLLVSLVFMSVMVVRRAGVGFAAQGRSVAPIALACVPAWGATRAVASALDAGPAGVALVGSVAAGTLAYVGALMVVAPGLLREALRQMGRTLGREPAPASS